MQSVGGLSIYNMDALTSMSGLDRLVNITGVWQVTKPTPHGHI
jgi:hypothetical protein